MGRHAPLTLASFLLGVVVAPGAYGQMTVSARSVCAPADSVYLIWTNNDHPGDPSVFPEVVGYDVMRRVLPGCDEFVRANKEIIPRVLGMTTHYFQELFPAPGALVQYRIVPVNADRHHVYIPGFCVLGPCVTYQVCPPGSAPVMVGTLEDFGSGVVVLPCPGTCYPDMTYLDEYTAAELASYVGTSATFRFFGSVGCNGFEGCHMSVNRWEPTTCVTEVKPTSWGRLKTIYR